MNFITRSSKKTLIMLALLAFAVVVGGYFISSYLRNIQVARFVMLFAQEQALYNQGSYTMAVSAGEQALAAAPTKSDALEAQYFIATSLLGEAQAGDVEQGLTMYGSILQNSAASPSLKAWVLSSVGALVSPSTATSTVTTLSGLAFDQQPFTQYLAQANGNISQAALLLFQAANEQYPTPIADYQMARLQALLLHEQTINPQNPQQLATATSMEEEIMQGDALLASLGTTTISQSYLLSLYIPRSLALGTLYFYFPTKITSPVVDAAYDQTVATMESAQNATYPKDQKMIFFLTYAASLNSREAGTKDVRILQLFADMDLKGGDSPSFDNFVLGLKQLPLNDNIRAQIPQLAKLSPAFSSYLSQIGW